MANPLSTLASNLEADIKAACGWTTEPVFFGSPRTQPTARTYAIVQLLSLERAPKSTPLNDEYEATWDIKIRLEDVDLTKVRFDRRAETWLTLREKLTPLAAEHGGSSAYGPGYGPLVEGGSLADINTPEEPDTELSLTFKCKVLLDRGRTNIT